MAARSINRVAPTESSREIEVPIRKHGHKLQRRQDLMAVTDATPAPIDVLSTLALTGCWRRSRTNSALAPD